MEPRKLFKNVSREAHGCLESSHGLFHLFYILIFFLFVSACANLGNPDGGPYDETPPKVVSALPANQATRSNKQKISILFDEYVKIENASEKVVVSPPQEEMANVRADGKRIKIELFDSLRPNTTYTIDFADAIVDNNESNPMGNFTYSFSTGEEIDTMEVSGYVLNASDLEPIKGILVGLYETNEDSIIPDSFFRVRPFDRVSRTNGSGRFVIKGVARNRRYRAFALQDMDNNFIFSQKSEMVAFDSLLFESSCKPDIRLDTIWRDSTHYDSIMPVRYTHFLPDDIVLRAFLEEGQDLHLLKTEREVPEKFTIYFTAPVDTLPRIAGINFDGDGNFIVEPSLKGDTITYWIPDTNLAYNDTLFFEYTFLDTDTLSQLVWKTDTLNLVPKTTHSKQQEQLQKEIEKWEKEQKKKQKRNKNLPPEENPYLITYLTAECKPSGAIDPIQVPTLVFSEPIDSIASEALHFQLKVDTLWQDAPYELIPSEFSPRHFRLYAEWDLGQQYQLIIDSATVHGALGHTNQKIKQDFRVRKAEEYGTLFIHLQPADTNFVVELLNGSDKVLRRGRADAAGHVTFDYLKPADYYMRCFEDTDGNGEWSTGEYDSSRRPETVYYFHKAMPVKAQWEVNEDWDLHTVPAMNQKPMKLVKQKPDKEKKVRERNKEREEKLKKEKQQRRS